MNGSVLCYSRELNKNGTTFSFIGKQDLTPEIQRNKSSLQDLWLSFGYRYGIIT